MKKTFILFLYFSLISILIISIISILGFFLRNDTCEELNNKTISVYLYSKSGSWEDLKIKLRQYNLKVKILSEYGIGNINVDEGKTDLIINLLKEDPVFKNYEFNKIDCLITKK